MRALKLSLLATTMMLGGFTMNAQSADEIMSKHVTAIGGDAWNKVNSMKTTADMTAAGMKVGVIETVVRGKGVRSDIMMNGQSGGYEIVTPTGGWNLDLMTPDAKPGVTKPVAMPEEQVKASQDQLDPSDDYIDYKAKGFKAEFVGKEDVNGTSCYKLKITGKSGIPKLVYFDAGNYYKIKDIETVQTAQGAMDISTTFSDFKKFPEGIVIAMKAKNDYQEITIKEVEINKTVPDSVFKPETPKN
jgi:hypothetical protein